MKSNEKGSVTLIVLVTILFIVIILSSFFIYIYSRRNAQIKETEEIAKSYDENMEKAYWERVQNNITRKNITEIDGNETKNIETEDKDGNRVVIPAGFKVINPEASVEDGIVIEDVSANNEDTVGNQFVWIPCTIDGSNGSIKYDRYAFSSDTLYHSQTKLNEKDADGSYKIQAADQPEGYYHEAIPEEDRASIEKYGGYYLGRYEIGCDIARNESSKGNIETIAKVKSNLNTYTYITKDEAKTISERMYSGKSKLCSSYAWDTALQFIGGTYAINSERDNYLGSIQKTGYYGIKNIYDMGGNACEWTTEEYHNSSYPNVSRRRKLWK